MFRQCKRYDQMILGKRLCDVVEAVLDRMRSNVQSDRPLEWGANPEQTCRELGVDIDYEGKRFGAFLVG